MRWGYIIPRVLLVAAIWAFFAFGFDPTLRLGAVYSGQKAVDAKVEIGSIKTSFAPLSLLISNAKVANHNVPGTNLIEFESLSMEVDGPALARKCLLVDEGELTGLQWGTPRQDSGLLPEVTSKKEADKKSEEKAPEDSDSTAAKTESEMQAKGEALFAGIADKAKLAVDPNQFESVRMGSDLEKKWNDNFGRVQNEANDLKKEVDDIKRLAQSNDGNKLERLEGYRKAAAEAKDALQKIKQLRGELDTEKQQARTDFAAFNQARDRDLAKIHDDVNLLKTDPQQIAEFLLGPELHHRMNEIIDWTKWAKSHYSKMAHDPPPERMRGEDIIFVHKAELPKVLIKLLKITGKGDVHGESLDFTGTVSGLTSNPVLLGEPAVLQMKGEGPADVDLKVVFDYTHPDTEPTHEVFLTYAAGNSPPLHLGDDKSLAVTVTAEKLVCRAQLKLVGESITGTLHFEQEPAVLTAKLAGGQSELQTHVMQALNDVFAGIKELQGELQISGKLDDPKLAIQSGIGQQVAGGINSALSHQIDEGRDILAGKLNEQVAAQTGKLQALFKQQVSTVTQQLNLNEQDVNQILQQATGGRLAELDKAVGKPLDALKKPGASGQPVDVKKAEDEIKGDLKKLFRR